MSDPIQSLADTLKAAAAKGTVTLTSSLLTAAGVNPPPGFDELLQKSFALDAKTPGLDLTFTAEDVGAVSENQFRVDNAQTAFLGTLPNNTRLSIRFSGNAPVDILIETTLMNWKITDSFPFMTGWPFDELALRDTGFVFTTKRLDAFPWNNTNITLLPGQTIAAVATVPDAIGPITKLLSLVGLPSAVVLTGPFDPSVVNNTTVLYPTMVAKGILTQQSVEVLSIRANNPALGLHIASVEDVDDDGKPTLVQTPSLFLGLTFDVTTMVSPATLELQADLDYLSNGIAFTLSSPPEHLLTPATIASLVLGQSYFQFVPPQLQQYLTAVGLYSLSASATLTSSPVFTALSAAIGSTPGSEWTIFGDPNSGQDFTIKGFVLQWLVLNPTSTKPKNQVSFSADLQIFPKVFHTSDNKPGVFNLSIDQDLSINGVYTGSVSLNDVLGEITSGAIGLPNGVEIIFSDVTISLDTSAKTYAFGFTLDASVDFLTIAGKTLLQIVDLNFDLQATLPQAQSKATTYHASMAGLLGIGPFVANADISYDGTAVPTVWKLQTALAQPLRLSALLDQFFEAYGLPSFLPGTLTVESFALTATLPSKPSTVARGARSLVMANEVASSYAVSGALRWQLSLGSEAIDILAQIGLQYDAARAEGQRFSGSVIGAISLAAIGAQLQIGYQFSKNSQGKENSTLYLQWEGLRAEYLFATETVTFSLKGWSVGTLLEALVRTIGDPYFTLAAPWDILNEISLDGLLLSFDLSKNAKNVISAQYQLSSPIDLGFMRINGLNFKRVNGKITLSIDGQISVPGLDQSPLFDPSSPGQDVQNMPNVPGQGNELFDLRLLALGQRVGIVGSEKFDSVKAVIAALASIPSTEGANTKNPVNPIATQPGQPYYAQQNSWLVAANFGLLRVGTEYTIELMVVFNDPAIYGLRLALAGTKAKVLAGLVIDVLYKKITDSIGLYQIDFSFPSIVRNLDFGTFSITLPSIGIQIYTNGDFLIDLGFPYKLDFSRSFTVAVIVPPGIPVLGSAGLYFGKLSSATSTSVPSTTKGSFDPIIVFGLGLQIGLGKYLDYGIFKAGFSITIFGSIEGTIAAWHPYALTTGLHPQAADREPQAMLAAGRGNLAQVQGDYYFKLAGTFGLLGKLYGTIDFAIIKAAVNLTIEVYAKVVYESFRQIPLSISAAVSVSVSVTIDLGFFSFDISFSFAITVTAQVSLGTDEISSAPWYDGPQLTTAALFALPSQPRVLRLQHPAMASIAPLPIKLFVTPQFTVLGPPNGTLAEQSGAFVFLLSTDAPTAHSHGNAENSSFEHLCQTMLAWILTSLSPEHGVWTIDLQTSPTTVSLAELQALQSALSVTSTSPLPAEAIMQFLGSDVLSFDVQTASAGETLLGAGATIFPPLPGMSIEIPTQGATTTIDFYQYTTITDTYRAQLAELLNELAAQVAGESRPAAPFPTDTSLDQAQPLAQYLFEDYFTLIARQLVQAAISALGDYPYYLQPRDSLASIMTWATERGNTEIRGSDIAQPNLEHPLRPNNVFQLAGLSATVQSGDTIQSIATRLSDQNQPARWTTLPADIIDSNATLRGWIAPNITVSYADTKSSRSYTTVAGDSFQSLAQGLHIELAQLSTDESLLTLKGLLVPAISFTVPTIAYQSAADDTLLSIMQSFGIGLEALLSTSTMLIPNIFAATSGNESIRISNLVSVYIDDVWPAIQTGDVVANTAGMVARYQLHGLRLPATSGLMLPAHFQYPTGLEAYGLYQLSGQQFPADLQAMATTLTLQKDSSLHWLQFNGSTQKVALPIDLSKQADLLAIVLSYAQSTGYDPQPHIEALPTVRVAQASFSVQHYALWSTSDNAGLQKITAGSSRSTVQALLWQLPPNVLQFVAKRNAGLAETLSISQALNYLPQFEPQLGTTDEATKQTTYTPVTEFAFATRIDIQIKRLAQTESLGPQRPTSTNIVPPSAGNTGTPGHPLAPHSYELLGASPADAALLERLLTDMTVLGDHIISDLWILQPSGGSGTVGFSSRAASEIVAFLTQTNLSTETHPSGFFAGRAGVDSQPTRGIINSSREFIQILWELSTVRSGGYYFYYAVPTHAEPLPSELFNADGVATLTLVIAYNRTTTPIAAGRLTSFINAFITTQAIDVARSVLSLCSESVLNPSLPLAQNSTLDQLTNIYGTSIGTLASLNAALPLVEGTPVPIAEAIHQVTSADLRSADPLATLAAYYGQGALAPQLTAQTIRDFNPGVPVALNALFRIPPITYRVATNAAPKNTLASISAYFGVPLDTLAATLRTSEGIFAENTVITVDSQAEVVQPALGPGNSGFSLSRINDGRPSPLPPDPTPAQKAAYGKAYLSSLYSLLIPALKENVFFAASPQGVPISPSHSPTGSAMRALRLPQTRRNYLAHSATLADLRYEQTLSFAKFSKLNAARHDGASLLPAQENPYIGVGGFAQIDVQWVDIFGNQTIVLPPASVLPIPISYTDQPVGLSQWPNVMSSYTYSGDAQRPILTILLNLQGKIYSDDQAKAKTDLPLFQKIAFQFEQNYDALGIPGLKGYAMSASIRNSFWQTPEIVLDAQAQQVRDFVKACYTYVAACAQGAAPSETPHINLNIQSTLADIRKNDIIPLELSFILARQMPLCDPALRARTDGSIAVSPIAPHTSPSSSEQVSLLEFAQNFEAIFNTPDWQMRIGTSNTGDAAVWAVRIGLVPGIGLQYAIDPHASFFAAKPLATALRGGIATIVPYTTGHPLPANGTPLTFNGVDLTLWAQQSLSAIDAFLSATYAAPGYLVDVLTSSNPETEGAVAQILQHKKTLAAAIARSVAPILETSRDDQQTHQAAEEKLLQQVLNTLGSAYTITAIVVFNVNNTNYHDPLAPGVIAPRFFGQPLPTLGDAKSDRLTNSNYALSSAKIGLTTEKDGKSRLAFAFESKNVKEQAFVPLTLAYAVSSLEHDITSIPEIANYQQSSWITFVTGPFTSAIGDGITPINIPVVLRELPLAPTLVGQSGLPFEQQQNGRPQLAPNASPADLAAWKYLCTYKGSQVAQDSLQATIEFNLALQPRALGAGDDALFGSLAQFITIYPQLLADFNAYLRQVDADSTASNPTVINAHYALAAFEQCVGKIAQAYDDWARPVADFSATAQPPHTAITFAITLEPYGPAHEALISVLPLKLVPTNAVLPNPVIDLDIEGYSPEALEPPIDNALASYRYVKHDHADLVTKGASNGPSYLSFQQACQQSQRTILFPRLDVLAYQNAKATIEGQRNVFLVPQVPTTPFFTFTTPEITFASPIVPLLQYAEYQLDPSQTKSLKAALTDFFQQFFAESNHQDVEVALQANFSYPLIEQNPTLRTIIPIALLPPTAAQASNLGFIVAILAAISTWRAAAKANEALPAARYSLTLQIYASATGGETAGLPLLRIESLWLAAKQAFV